MTENARDRLAQFITWIIGLKMAGNNDVNLTEAEARQPEEGVGRRPEEPQRDL